jgi:mRNA interferase MazF
VSRAAREAGGTGDLRRGSIWWATLGEPRGSAPGFRRPVVVLQSDRFNRSRISTVVVVVVTSNLKLADAPGNVLLKGKAAGLARDSVANVSQLITVDKAVLTELVGQLPRKTLRRIEDGVRLVLGLDVDDADAG